MNAPLVTVLTAVRNGVAHLQETIDSILAQDFAEFEYLIVDDASDDGTPALVEQAARRDPRIRVLRGIPRIRASARTRGRSLLPRGPLAGSPVAPGDIWRLRGGRLRPRSTSTRPRGRRA